MEGPVSGIRKSFLHGLTEDYLENQKSSLLYRTFWRENMTGLLKEHFPELLGQELPAPKDAGELKKQLCEAMKRRPEWAGELPARKQSWKLRRNFWEELWLNDAGYRAELITDTEYYLWLVRYLAVHDVYYKTNIYYYKDGRRDERMNSPGYPWLFRLLYAGLEMDEGELKREIAARKKARNKARREARKQSAAEAGPPGEETGAGPSEEELNAGLSLADVEEALAMLAEQVQADRDKIAGRLHKLRHVVRDKDRRLVKTDYLRWLTARLEWMALHVKIKNWLQDSGYPLVSFSGTRKLPKKGKKARKSDFTMRLFEAWWDTEGCELHKKGGNEAGPGAGPGNWRLEGQGFCVLDAGLDPDRLRALLEDQAAEQDEAPSFYLPLAVHLRSGCVFFLAGKGNYEQVYQDAEEKEEKKEKKGKLWSAYTRTKVRYCFDYLHPAENYSLRPPGDGTFCLSPAFHENAKYGYADVLDMFKDYCEDRYGDTPIQTVREYNGAEPAGIPEALLWAFDIDG